MDLEQELQSAKAARAQLEQLQEQASKVEVIEREMASRRLKRQAEAGLEEKSTYAGKLVDGAAEKLQGVKEKFSDLTGLIREIVTEAAEAETMIHQAIEEVRQAAGQSAWAENDGLVGLSYVEVKEVGWAGSRLAARIWSNLNTGKRLRILPHTEDALEQDLVNLICRAVEIRSGVRFYRPDTAKTIKWM